MWLKSLATLKKSQNSQLYEGALVITRAVVNSDNVASRAANESSSARPIPPCPVCLAVIDQ